MTILNPSPPAPARVLLAGHSHAADGGASVPDFGGFHKLASHLQPSRLNSLAQGGARLCMPEGTNIGGATTYAGYARFLQNVTVKRTAAPYVAGQQMAALMWGVNDMAWMGPTTFQAVMPHHLRAVVSRARAGAVFEDTDASVAYTGASWANVGATTFNSGTQIKQVATNGDSLTITVPADFPGGTIALGFGTGVAGQGALWTVTGTGSCSGVNTTFDTRNINGFTYGGTRAANGVIGCSALRLTGLPSGSGTITAVATTVQTNAYFDYWQIEAPSPGGVALIRDFRPYDYTLWAGNPYNAAAGLSDTDVATCNSVIDAMVTEFNDPRVFSVTTDDVVNKNLSLFASDHAHLNDQGHGLLAARLIGTLSGKLTLGQLSNPAVIDKPFWFPFGGSGTQTYQNAWADVTGSYPPGGAYKDVITGRMMLRGGVTKTTGAANDIIVTLSVGWRPAYTMDFTVPVYNGTAFTTGTLRVNNDGTVFMVAGGSIAAGSFNSINCTFLAEQ